MRDDHIIKALESVPLSQLSNEELQAVRAHSAVCPSCATAYEAAQISQSLLKARASESFTPSPFFSTRVLAALRERQVANESWALGRLWRTAGALVSTMAATVAALVVLTLVEPGNPSDSQDRASLGTNATVEEVILNQSESLEDEASDAQVFTTLYEIDEGVVR
jgi:anti-sigma factor RsiW